MPQRVDAELTGPVVPIKSAPSAAAAGSDASLFVSGAPTASPRRTFTGKVASSAPGGDVQMLLLSATGGAVLTLLGVLVGYRLGRRS
jgi:hypothetical protein